MQDNPAKTKIVILGTGFGGVYTFLHLKSKLKEMNAEVTLVGKTNYFLFTPMLHEVATGGLNSEHIVESVRGLMINTPANFIQTNIKSIDLGTKIVHTECCNLAYDYLVVATGADTNTFGIAGVEKCLTLKNLKDAEYMRTIFINAFEEASKELDPAKQKELLSFAIIGGGATGVELAAEMSELFYDTMDKYYPTFSSNQVSIKLIAATPDLISQFAPELRELALNSLRNKKVEILLNTTITKIEDHEILTSTGQKIKARFKIWVAGVKANTPVFESSKVLIDKTGRLVTDKFLRVKKDSAHEWDNVFALGDVASFLDKENKPLPMLAQVAVKEAPVIAENIQLSIKSLPLIEFDYTSSGSLVSLGHKNALGDLWGMKLSGPHIWWLWRTIYLFKMASFKKMFKVVVDWTVNLFYPRDITKS